MRLPSREFLSFGAIGSGATGLSVPHNASFVGLLGPRPSLAFVLSMALLIPPTCLAQRALTFRSRRSHAQAFPRHLATQAAGTAFGLGKAFAALASTANYVMHKLWTFSHPG